MSHMRDLTDNLLHGDVTVGLYDSGPSSNSVGQYDLSTGRKRARDLREGHGATTEQKQLNHDRRQSDTCHKTACGISS